MKKNTKNKIIATSVAIVVALGSIGIGLYKANKYIESIMPTKKDFDPFRKKR